jgi:hypothetical protein
MDDYYLSVKINDLKKIHYSDRLEVSLTFYYRNLLKMLGFKWIM